MKIDDPQQVKIGDWVTMCCEEDLFQIVTEEQLADVRECITIWQEEDTSLWYERWDSELDALIELRRRYAPGHPDNNNAIAEIDARIAKLVG